ncbi:glycosyltransferase family 1 protein [Mucilaginibacter sp. L196]|uniref:glycosyltransferase family 4 protein n=1 Tax=Mucilaginibacter sp. L196 TaxID=1641870 RepID=UPI00131A805A|nr:glycosyltransferase family 1 protein [Mucilaginibacter sp. L196]
MSKPSILLTFDSMKYPNSGFFSFGKSLGDAILTQNKARYRLYYYVHKRSTYLFNRKVSLVYLSKLHKLFFPEPKRFELIHFTDQYCRLKPQKVKGKKILTIHDINPVHEQRKSSKKIEKHLNKLRGYINACDKIVTISNFVAKDILKYFPEAEGKVSVIYNGADQLQVTEGHTPKYQPKKAFLYTIGFVAPKKNFHVLPPLLVGNDYELIIAGVETPYKSVIMEEAQKFGVADRVKITGPISEDDKAWYYKNCEAFVFPSIAEGFGLPVIEAMHFGKPVFLSTHTSLPEIGGDAAFYFENFEPEVMQSAFAKGMEAFKTNDMQQKVITHAMQFDWQKTARQYLKLYDECLGL